jgi:hypothetical protein
MCHSIAFEHFHIGFEERQFTNNYFIPADNCKTIILKEEKEELNQVLITTYLTGLHKDIWTEVPFKH